MIYNILLNAMNLPKSVEIIVVIAIVLLSATLGFFVIRSILKEQKNWKNRESKTGLIPYKDFEDYVKAQLRNSKKKTQLAVFHLDILDSAAISKSLGETQYNNAVLKLVENIRLVFDSVIRVAKLSNETLYVGMKIKDNKKQVSIENIAKQVLIEAKKSIALAGILKVEFGVNLGVVISPEAGETWEELKQNLELTVVSSKRKGANEYSIYSLEISNKESEEYKSYLEIKEAIENKEFTLYYQPIVDLVEKEVWAAETLLRWKHKDRGVLPPSSFLNIMEHTGDINWVGFWAIEQLFRQVAQWKVQYPDVSLKFNINLSEKQLMNNNLTEELRRLTKKHKVQPGDFFLEIVESLLLAPVRVIKENIQKLHQMGFLLAVDNYGGINSSLQIFTDFKLSMIKLSAKFVQSAKEKDLLLNMLKMIIGYAKNNDILVVSEGIEDKEFLEYIESIDVRLGQGFYFARPGSSVELINSVLLTPWME